MDELNGDNNNSGTPGAASVRTQQWVESHTRSLHGDSGSRVGASSQRCAGETASQSGRSDGGRSVRSVQRRRTLVEAKLRRARELQELEMEHLRQRQALEEELQAVELEEEEMASVHSGEYEGSAHSHSGGSEVRLNARPSSDADYQTVSEALINPPASKESDTKPPPVADSIADAGKPAADVAQCLTAALQAVNLPKPELVTFSGSTKDYIKFIKNFEASIEAYVADPRQKLNYLIQHCSGSAKSSIEDCVVLEPHEGYARAKNILDRRYGRPWQVAEDHLRTLTEGPQVKSGDFKGLSELSIEIQKSAINLDQLGFESEINNSSILRKIVRRLPYNLRSKWADVAHRISQRGRCADYRDLTEFIQEKEEVASSMFGRDLEAKDSKSHSDKSSRLGQAKNRPNNHRGPGTTFATNGASQAASTSNCAACNGKCASLKSCTTFAGKALHERFTLVRQHKLCFNCLKPGHGARECRANKQCSVEGCPGKHHQLLHRWSAPQESAQDAREATACTVDTSTKVSLGILPVTILGPAGKSVNCHALLDNGSTRSFIEETLVHELGLDSEQISFTLSTLAAQSAQVTGREVKHLTIATDLCPEGFQLTEVWTTPAGSLPCGEGVTEQNLRSWAHLRDLPLQPCKNYQVRLLIGVESSAIVPLEVRPPPSDGGPYAERTVLGWVLRGPHLYSGAEVNKRAEVRLVNAARLESSLSRLWDTDFSEVQYSERSQMSREDHTALDVMQGSVQKNGGHYQVALPWSDDSPLPPSKAYASLRLESIKKKFLKDPDLHRMYTEQIQEYIDQDYAEPAGGEETPGRTWYLPHHPVVNVHKPGKVRVVFDGAARCGGTSLNDHLHQGPDLINNLAGVLMRFRLHEVALMADIKAMFHQVLVPSEQRDVLRFLWWPEGDINQTPATYRMTRHIFGLRSSPACAAFAMRQAARDQSGNFNPAAASAVLEDFYVDDFLRSVPTMDEAFLLVRQLPELLERGGFQLVKWSSNCPEVEEVIPEERRASRSPRDLNSDDTYERTLGMLWSAGSDAFVFCVSLKSQASTRRGILSTVSTIFDPLGLLAPVLLPAKKMLQQLSKCKLQWDERIPDTNQEEWHEWCCKAGEIEGWTIPRLYSPYPAVTYELHVFSDASEAAYGAGAYLRVYCGESTVACSLVMGKARLAPIRPMTIPRLELTAAMVASRLRNLVVEELRISLSRVVMWTDSTIVLGYIRNTTARYKPFVSNRLVTIHDYTSPEEWRHVPTHSNPADLASRGFGAEDRVSRAMWLNGPEFLLLPESEWPPDVSLPTSSQLDDPEVKVLTTVSTCEDTILQFCKRYSSLDKVLRSVAWWLRFKSALRREPLNQERTLSVNELQAAELLLLRSAQQRQFPSELERLLQHKPVLSSSKLATLDPILQEGLICTGSRLKFASEPVTPVILANKDPLTALIINDFHSKNGHVGTEQVLALTRSKYWILNGRSAVRRELAACRPCRRLTSQPVQQKMGQVLQEQLKPDLPPFFHTGVDLFGPILVKQRRSTVKRYGVIFTCLASRAVHFEIVHSLDTDSFLGAMSRFSARRGTPAKMFSDRGTNLRAADKELREGLQVLEQDVVASTLAGKGIAWHFNPAHASHMGGLWERLIRSTRKILQSLTHQQPALSDEALLTFIAEVERILNSRPLTYVSSDPRDPEVLTPSKLLLLRGSCFPPGVFDKAEPYVKRWWRQAQYLSSVFWRRWVKEYIPNLLVRQKWHRPARNLQVGDVVLVVDLHLPRGQWPLAVIQSVKLGRDDLVRSAVVKTSKSLLTRPASQLCLLEAAED